MVKDMFESGMRSRSRSRLADTFWSEPEPEPPKRFARSWSRKKRAPAPKRHTIVEK